MEPRGTEEAAATTRSGVSRRRVLGGAGVALAGGLAASAVIAPAATAATDTATDAVAAGGAGSTAFEFLCRIGQNGVNFSGVGYLTAVAGIDGEELFTPGPRDEGHARLVATAEGTLVARSVDGVVHALDIEGRLDVYLLSDGGASFEHPVTFKSDQQLAGYTLELQDVLTVIAPNVGLPVLNGTAQQDVVGTYAGRRFGRNRLALRFIANGLGRRTDAGPNLDNAQANLTVAGSLVVV